MKKYTIITLLLLINLFAINICNAQRLVAGSQARGEFTAFDVKSISADSIMVTDSANPYVDETAKLKTYPQSAFKRRHGDLFRAFTGSIGDERIRQLINERSIGVSFYINDEGKVEEVTYFLRKNTELTAMDLERLTLRIREETRYTAHNKTPVADKVFLVSRTLKYRDILDFRVD